MRLYRRAWIASTLLAVSPLHATPPRTGHEPPTAAAIPIARPTHDSPAAKPLANGSSMRLRTAPAAITGALGPAHVAAPVINGSTLRHPRASP